jgi:CubicO group peptidase (beta-lactamase class C family)
MFVDMLPGFPLSFQPGEHWKYSYAIDVVGHLVAVISGKSLTDFIKENIFEPLQMTHTTFVLMPGMQDDLVDCFLDHPVTGQRMNITPFQAKAGSYQKGTIESGGGGLVSTVGDYFRFCQCLLNGGELDGKRLVSRRTIEYMSLNHIGDESDNADMFSMSVSDAYTEAPMPGVGMGLGLSVMLNPARAGLMQSKGSVAWGGLANTIFFCDPAEELVVIFMTQVIGLNRQKVPINSLLTNAVYSGVVNGKPNGMRYRGHAPSL